MNILRCTLMAALLAVSSPALAAEESGVLSRVKNFFATDASMEAPSPARARMPRPDNPGEGKVRLFDDMPERSMLELPVIDGVSSVKEPDANGVEQARKIIQILDMDSDKPPLHAMPYMRAMPYVMRANQGNEEKVSKVIEALGRKAEAGQKAAVRESVVKAYTHYFSTAELERLHAFLESETGRKFLKVKPTLDSYGMMSANIRARSGMKQAMSELVEELKKNDLKIPSELEP